MDKAALDLALYLGLGGGREEHELSTWAEVHSLPGHTGTYFCEEVTDNKFLKFSFISLLLPKVENEFSVAGRKNV